MKVFISVIPLIFWLTAEAGTVNTQGFGNTAIKGYDPVAYFTDGKPTEGDARFSHEWQGAEWQFSSAANRDRFIAHPENYAPQYGGYCAYAVANGYTARIDPEAWKIVDGKLYLNYSASVQQSWIAKMEAYIHQADRNWPQLKQDL